MARRSLLRGISLLRASNRFCQVTYSDHRVFSVINTSHQRCKSPTLRVHSFPNAPIYLLRLHIYVKTYPVVEYTRFRCVPNASCGQNRTGKLWPRHAPHARGSEMPMKGRVTYLTETNDDETRVERAPSRARTASQSLSRRHPRRRRLVCESSLEELTSSSSTRSNAFYQESRFHAHRSDTVRAVKTRRFVASRCRTTTATSI